MGYSQQADYAQISELGLPRRNPRVSRCDRRDKPEAERLVAIRLIVAASCMLRRDKLDGSPLDIFATPQFEA